MGKALYRKYRSRRLDEIVGQPHVTELLRRALKQGRVAHAYLFTGPKGVGKTSIARILAHEINELPYDDEASQLDIIEIDAASNNGVEDIRDLRDKVQIAPVSAKKKVYIIDEVHMLSKQAFNALLKTLEEPPEHVVFILATTDVDKVPDTIKSRTQQHTFRRASIDDLVTNLIRISKAENVKVEPAAVRLIAEHSEGSFRDSVSLFDQMLNLIDTKESLTTELVALSLGLADETRIVELMKATLEHDVATIVKLLNELDSKGTPSRTVVDQLLIYCRSKISDDERFLQLLDQLLNVSYSSQPNLKLLTTLSLFAAPERPSSPQPSQTKQQADTLQPAAPKKAPKPTPKAQVVNKPRAQSVQTVVAVVPLDWQSVLTYIQTHHVALYSVLCKCEAIAEETTIKLYTKSQFYKKKLDDSKYSQLLYDALDAVNMGGYEIETMATHAPLKDSQAAKVAAIMGGGEEVSVESDT